MSNFIKNFKELNLLNKIILVALSSILLYFSFNFIFQYLEDKRIRTETAELNFEVESVTFEESKYIRNFGDEFIILNLKKPITKEQFEKMSFVIPEEKVKAELMDEKKIKVTFLSEFIKNKQSSISVFFYKKNIYTFTYKHALEDAEFLRNNPPYDSFPE